MKKRIVLLICAIFALAGCSGLQIGDDANNAAIAYASGKAFGYGIAKYTDLDDPLSDAWVDMMTKNAGTDPIPPEMMVEFYNYAFLQIAGSINDPYGLIGDLSVLLTLYGAQYSDGELVALQPVPLRVAKYFELGYRSGKQIAIQIEPAALDK